MPRDGRAVLVVDDDRINRALLSKLLENEGYRSRTAVDGREALTALGEEPFDAVLLDIVMPEIDGLEVLRTLKGDATLWHIPVIVISGLEDVESIVECLELGADDYVQKPFDPVLLRARLNACLARRQFHDLEVEYQKIVQEQAAELEELRREASKDSNHDSPRSAPVAVLAVGLTGLTDIAAETEPAAVIALVDMFHATVQTLADRCDGSICGQSADRVTVVFGDPAPNLASGGVTMAAALDQELAAVLPPPALSWRAGLGAGDATVGTVSRIRAPHTAAVGPVVDRAVQLCSLAPRGVVLLDEGAFAAVRARPGGELDAERWGETGDSGPPVYRLHQQPVDGS